MPTNSGMAHKIVIAPPTKRSKIEDNDLISYEWQTLLATLSKDKNPFFLLTNSALLTHIRNYSTEKFIRPKTEQNVSNKRKLEMFVVVAWRSPFNRVQIPNYVFFCILFFLRLVFLWRKSFLSLFCRRAAAAAAHNQCSSILNASETAVVLCANFSIYIKNWTNEANEIGWCTLNNFIIYEHQLECVALIPDQLNNEQNNNDDENEDRKEKEKTKLARKMCALATNYDVSISCALHRSHIVCSITKIVLTPLRPVAQISTLRSQLRLHNDFVLTGTHTHGNRFNDNEEFLVFIVATVNYTQNAWSHMRWNRISFRGGLSHCKVLLTFARNKLVAQHNVRCIVDAIVLYYTIMHPREDNDLVKIYSVFGEHANVRERMRNKGKKLNEE